jgi:peptidoglycan/LPS O-acetylase OafA/YrhL
VSSGESPARPSGVYLTALYFVVAGFLDSIQKYREWGSVLVLNPLSEGSLWHLGANTLIYLAAAYLLWRLTRLGRILALVYAYLILLTHLGVLLLHLLGRVQLTQFHVLVAAFHIGALPLIISYLQPARRKPLFNVSLIDVLIPRD